MEDRIGRAIDAVGTKVTVCGESFQRNGKAVIYPLRYRQNRWGGVEVSREGLSKPGRYLMFCSKELADGLKRGDIISDDENRYLLVFMDEYCSRSGNYTRICMRREKMHDNE